MGISDSHSVQLQGKLLFSKNRNNMYDNAQTSICRTAEYARLAMPLHFKSGQLLRYGRYPPRQAHSGAHICTEIIVLN
jgi:hypothetical protein